MPPPSFSRTTQKKCMDLEHGDTTNGNAVQIWDCNNRHTQGWVFKGDRLVYKANQSKCVDLRGGNVTNGAKLQIWDCMSASNTLASNQGWTYESGQLGIKLTKSGGKKCIDVPSGRAWNGHDLQIWDCDHSEGQRWALASEDLTQNDAGYVWAIVTVSIVLVISLAVNCCLWFRSRHSNEKVPLTQPGASDVIGKPAEENRMGEPQV